MSLYLFSSALCALEDFEKAIAFGRTRRSCSAPVTATSSVLISAEQPKHFSFSQYVSASFLFGLVALCAFLGIRSQRKSKKTRGRWGGDEAKNLLG